MNINDIKNICEKYFDIAGVCKPNIPNKFKKIYIKWIKDRKFSKMNYLERHLEKKLNPQKVLQGVENIIVVGLNYYQDDHNSGHLNRIAKIARGEDYHILIEEKQKLLIEYLKQYYPNDIFKSYVDYGYAWERLYASMAGLGWIGKNNCLITEKYGSWVSLGVIYTTANIINVRNKKIISKCGDCDMCIRSCPNKALFEYEIDSSKCISYQTIESKEDISPGFNTKGYIYGCDICQKVCPFNKISKKSKYFKGEEFLDVNNLDDNVFAQKYKKTCLYRTGLLKLTNNYRQNLKNNK